MAVQDTFASVSSPLHRLDARVKLVLTTAFLLTAAFIPRLAWPVYPLLLAVPISASFLSGFGPGPILKRSLLAIPFVLAALPLVFTIPGPALTKLSLGSWHLSMTLPGIARLASIALKSWISIQVVILLSMTTPRTNFLGALRSVHVPRLLVAVAGLMWQFLAVMTTEAQKLIHARAARSGAADYSGRASGGTLFWRARVTGSMAGSLMLRSLERSERVYAAMQSRGYDGEIRLLRPTTLAPRERLTLLLGLAVLLALILLGVWVG